jgi:hypothetical protein
MMMEAGKKRDWGVGRTPGMLETRVKAPVSMYLSAALGGCYKLAPAVESAD